MRQSECFAVQSISYISDLYWLLHDQLKKISANENL